MALSKNRRKTGGVPAGGSTGQVLKKTSGTDYDYAWGNDSAGTLTFPPGIVLDYMGDTPPAGWLLLDGTQYNTATYADLYSAIGLIYCLNFTVSGSTLTLNNARTPQVAYSTLTSGTNVFGPVRVAAYSGATLPSGLAVDTDYWMRYPSYPIPATPTFKLYASEANAIADVGSISLGAPSLGTNGFYSIEQSGKFRVPYAINYFRRNFDPAGTRTLGSYAPDTLGTHDHRMFNGRDAYTGLSAGNSINRAWTGGTSTDYKYAMQGSSATDYPPTIGVTSASGSSETSPKNINCNAIIKT